jgi:hypothetical protein
LRITPQAQVERLESRALLANIHFVGTPVVTVNEDNSVTVSGKIAGLGDNQSVTVAVDVPVTFTVVCENPAGKIAPGQTHTGTLTGTGTFTSDKNGNVVFSVTTDAPEASPEDCPNPKWTPVIRTSSSAMPPSRRTGSRRPPRSRRSDRRLNRGAAVADLRRPGSRE